MSFTIKNFRNTSTSIVLSDPISGEPLMNPESNTAVELEIVGQDSRIFADAKLAAELKTIELMKGSKKLSPSDHRELAFEMFAAFVVGWNDTAASFFADELDGDGSYSPEKALKLLSNPDYWWIVQQLEKVVAERNRFFPKQ